MTHLEAIMEFSSGNNSEEVSLLIMQYISIVEHSNNMLAKENENHREGWINVYDFALMNKTLASEQENVILAKLSDMVVCKIEEQTQKNRIVYDWLLEKENDQ